MKPYIHWLFCKRDSTILTTKYEFKYVKDIKVYNKAH